MDQGEVWAAPVRHARIDQGGDGGVVGVSDLQHSHLDSAALETTHSGGDATSGKTTGEEGRVEHKIGEFRAVYALLKQLGSHNS